MVRPAPLLMLCLALSFSTTLAQTVTPYFKQATDTCTDGGGDSGGSKIATTAACKAAASMWNGEPGPKSVGITEVDLSDEPAGCIATNFAKTGMTVRFNSNADTVVKCSAGTVCLCSYTKGCPTNTRPPSEMPNGWVSGPCEMTGTGGRGASIKTCGDSTCSGCGAGQYRPLETTDTGCLTCAEGKIIKDGKCAECDGRVKYGTQICVTCAAGKYSAGFDVTSDDDCKDCAAGFYSAGKGSSECTSCKDEGSTKYTDKEGQAACEDCPSSDEVKQEKVAESCRKTCPTKNVGCTKSGGSRVSSPAGAAGVLLLSVVVLLNYAVY